MASSPRPEREKGQRQALNCFWKRPGDPKAKWERASGLMNAVELRLQHTERQGLGGETLGDVG